MATEYLIGINDPCNGDKAITTLSAESFEALKDVLRTYVLRGAVISSITEWPTTSLDEYANYDAGKNKNHHVCFCRGLIKTLIALSVGPDYEKERCLEEKSLSQSSEQ
ncbi:MAG: hypothetical protein WCV72_05180 [Patescibacteria group bacterium]